MAEVIIATPSIKIGIESGRTITALNIAVFPIVRALPRAPSKLSSKVPIRRLTKSAKLVLLVKIERKYLLLKPITKELQLPANAQIPWQKPI